MIEHCFRGLHDDGVRSRQATADGQCLYHSVSLLCFGNQDHSLEIKLFTAIEMIANEEELKHVQSVSVWGNSCGATYDHDVLSCLSMGKFKHNPFLWEMMIPFWVGLYVQKGFSIILMW